MSRKYKMDDSEQLNKSPRKKAKVCLKTLEIKIDEEVEEELDETVWMDLDEFYSNEGSFHTAKSQHDTEKPQDLSHMALLASEAQANKLDPMTGSDSTLGQNDDNRSESDFRQVKRLIWGEEVPCNTTAVPLDSNQANSLLSVGANPLITIRPASRTEKNKDDIVITSGSLTTSLVVNASNRVLNIDQLRNYFLLTQGEATSGTETSQYKANQQQYFLSLLDPSMPRMTNCGYYFRMRYAVYILLSQVTRSMCQFSSTSNWRQRAQERLVQERGRDTRKGPLLHIGEMHLYTIFPKDGKLVHSNLSSEQLPWWCKGGKTNFIHYENISFFVNQTPLTMEEQASLRVTENDINQMVLSFRRFLKHINSTVVSAKMANLHSGGQVTYNSTYLQDISERNTTITINRKRMLYWKELFISEVSHYCISIHCLSEYYHFRCRTLEQYFKFRAAFLTMVDDFHPQPQFIGLEAQFLSLFHLDMDQGQLDQCGRLWEMKDGDRPANFLAYRTIWRNNVERESRDRLRLDILIAHDLKHTTCRLLDRIAFKIAYNKFYKKNVETPVLNANLNQAYLEWWMDNYERMEHWFRVVEPAECRQETATNPIGRQVWAKAIQQVLTAHPGWEGRDELIESRARGKIAFTKLLMDARLNHGAFSDPDI